MYRHRWVVFVAAVMIAAVAACGGGGGGSAKKKSTTKSAKPVVAPLTGLPDPGGQSGTRPALSVKIENTPPARPQTGLDVADVVYEQITEGDITRFIAVFNSTIPDVAGPVRSVRAMDPDVVAPLGGIFAYSGGIRETVNLIRQAPSVNSVDETQAGSAMFRDKSRKAPENLYGRGPGLLDKGGKPIPVPPLFNYLDAGAAFNGDPVAQFRVGFKAGYAVAYAFDAASNTWKRSQGLTPHTVASGQQIAPTNVVVQFVGCCVPSPEGGAYQTVGQGDAWVFSAGKLTKGKWSRSDRAQPTQYTDAAGAPIKLTPGRTWIEFLPASPDYPVDVTPGAPTPAASTAPPTTRR
jgi:Protein of unknown function (DUF3048) N-terminal domain/Protein of unknown function (DUF3048) C-terminal domain